MPKDSRFGKSIYGTSAYGQPPGENLSLIES